MTVSEMIEALRSLQGDLPVLLEGCGGCDNWAVSVEFVEESDFIPHVYIRR